MRFTEISAADFNLAMTLDSGQVFHWEKVGNGFVGLIGDAPVYAEQRGDVLRVVIERGAPATPGQRPGKGLRSQEFAPPVAQSAAHYFALDHPLAEICASFPDDPIMNAARQFCRGLRIIRQPKWECLATFICSSMKQVAHIRQISLALRRRFGERRRIGNHFAYTFPPARRIARASENGLRECALGYRARNLLMTARLVNSGKASLEAWSALPDADLREKLCALPGVGMKVANCVMLFAYERHARMMKQVLLRVSAVVAKIRFRKFAQPQFGDFFLTRKILLFQNPFDPDVDWKCAHGVTEDRLPSRSWPAGFQPAEPEGRQDARLPSQVRSLTSSASCQHPWAEIMFQP